LISLTDSFLNTGSFLYLNYRTLTGEDEGKYSWMSVNFLLGSLPRDSEGRDISGETMSANVLEVGGGSVQVVSCCGTSADNMNSPESLFQSIKAKSYLGLGAQQFEAGLKADLAKTSDPNSSAATSNPCGFLGY
jgi:hypothetical protein